MKRDKIEVSLIISIIAFVVAAFFFWNQSKKVVIKSEIPYNERSSTSYKVYLDENEYYDTEYLDEGMQYISSIIKNIELGFNYSASYDEIKDYELSKNVTAEVAITDSDDNKVIYSKKEKIKSERSTVDELLLSDTINIDYKKYNKLVNEMKTKYGISANCDLIVTYSISYISVNGEISDAKQLNVTIPLSRQMISIRKGSDVNGEGLYSIEDRNSVFNIMMSVFTILMILFTGVDIIVLIVRINDRINKESKYDRFIKKVLRDYDSYITESKGESFLPNKPIIKLNSFKEIIDVRNNIDKTIIYTKLSNNACKFEIIDEVIYEYVATRDEIENS